VFVLEDDAVFNGSIDVLAEAIDSMKAAGLGLLYTGPNNHPENTISRSHDFSQMVAPRICRVQRNLGTMAYIITRGAAFALLKIIEDRGHYVAIDHIMNHYAEAAGAWVCVSPPPFSLDAAAGSDIPFAPWDPTRGRPKT